MNTLLRPIIQEVTTLLKKPLPVFQVITGPRQVGKTTAAQQIAKSLEWPFHYATADLLFPGGPDWIEAQWQVALTKASKSATPVLLILDEVQKIYRWSEVLKKLWDNPKTINKIKLLILGSSASLLQKGLSENLAGRFFLHPYTHWSYKECQETFGWDLNQWLYFGGYPRAALLANQEDDWKQYISDSLIETTLARDVMQMQAINKPTLLRQLFALSAHHPAQILSYNKMLGQLQDAGNTTTLAHYLKLMENAFLISGLDVFSRGTVRKKGSSPKLILWNNALINALSPYNFKSCMENLTWYGHIVENAVGAHLLNHLTSIEWDLSYWREGDSEVDFVITHGDKIYALEVKSRLRPKNFNFEKFKKKYPNAQPIFIGTEGIDLETFFSTHPTDFLENL